MIWWTVDHGRDDEMHDTEIVCMWFFLLFSFEKLTNGKGNRANGDVNGNNSSNNIDGILSKF